MGEEGAGAVRAGAAAPPRAADVAAGGQGEGPGREQGRDHERHAEHPPPVHPERRGALDPGEGREPRDPPALDVADAPQQVRRGEHDERAAVDPAGVQRDLGEQGGQRGEDEDEAPEGERVEQRLPHRHPRGRERERRAGDDDRGDPERGQQRADDRGPPVDPAGEHLLEAAGLLLAAGPAGDQGDAEQRHDEAREEAELVLDDAAEGADALDPPVEGDEGVGGHGVGVGAPPSPGCRRGRRWTPRCPRARRRPRAPTRATTRQRVRSWTRQDRAEAAHREAPPSGPAVPAPTASRGGAGSGPSV